MHFFETKTSTGKEFCPFEETKNDCFSHGEIQATENAHQTTKTDCCSGRTTELDCSSHDMNSWARWFYQSNNQFWWFGARSQLLESLHEKNNHFLFLQKGRIPFLLMFLFQRSA